MGQIDAQHNKEPEPAKTSSTTPRHFEVGDTKIAQCEQHGDYEAKCLAVLLTRPMWTRCKACEESMQTAERHRQEIAEKRARAAKLDTAHIPPRFRSKTLESYSVRDDEQLYAKETAQSFAEHFAQHKKQGTFLVLSGLVGTGKTHLSLAIAQHVISNNTVFYTSAIDAIRSIRATWRFNSSKTEAQALAEFTGVDLLIIDEIGVQYGTESEQISLFDIIDKRYCDLKPTILISNLTKAELKGFLGERSFDRLREGGLWVDFLWESFRGAVP